MGPAASSRSSRWGEAGSFLGGRRPFRGYGCCPSLEAREFVRALSGDAPKEQKRSVAHLRLLALILGFLGWVTLAYALALLPTHDRAVVLVDGLGT